MISLGESVRVHKDILVFFCSFPIYIIRRNPNLELGRLLSEI